MRYYVGLDVSVKTTSVCIVDEAGKVVKERSLPTEPDLIAAWLDKTGLTFERVDMRPDRCRHGCMRN